MPYKGPVYGKRTAARRIQSAWRRKKKYQKDTIKTKSDVRKAVQATAPSRAYLLNGSFSITTTPLTLQSFGIIPFNEDGITNPQSRQSLKISVGSIRLRGNLVVGDSTNIVRLLLVRGKNQTGTVFNPAEVFFDNNAAVAVPSVDAQINTRNVECLWDQTYQLQDTDSSDPGVRPTSFYINKKFTIRNNWTYNQTANAGVILPRNMKEYYLIGVSDSVVLPNPSIRFSSCTWFKNLS